MTLKKDTVIIKKKYTVNGEGFVLDKIGTKYKVGSCVWKWNYDYRNTWEKLNEGREYEIEYYGFNIPVLNRYYKIVGLEKINITANLK